MPTTLHTRDFRAFIDQVQSDRLRAIAQHWDLARGGQLMPSFAQLRPATIAPQLSIIWVYSYDRRTKRFTGRLAGDRISQNLGKNFRGIALEDVHPPRTLSWNQEILSRVVLEPACGRSGGQLFRKGGMVACGERIVLPLAENGIHGDGILGASDFQFPAGQQQGEVESLCEDERWFALD